MAKLKVLKETRSFIAIHKPAGLVVYADEPKHEPISAKRLLEGQLRGRKLFPVHRLDKQTCGILVYAFSPQVAAKLAEAFRGRGAQKKYLAIVHGIPPKDGSIDKPLPKNKEKELQSAKTNFIRLQSQSLMLEGEERSYALVRLEPKTGRYHQIRRHLRAIEHPIVGDPEYGNSWNNRVFAKEFGIERTLLSAVSLSFPDPVEREKFVFLSTKPDPDFTKLCETWGWKL